MIYSCDALERNPVPFLFFNGDLDPLSNISGLVERPLKFNASEYTTSFPPMQFGIDHILHKMGCTRPKKHTTFRNGSLHNRTHCTSYVSDACTTNVTYCVANAGHRWYGSTYNQYEICRWEGYDNEACDTASDLELYGPNTYSISVAYQSLDFFDRIGAGMVMQQQQHVAQTLAPKLLAAAVNE